MTYIQDLVTDQEITDLIRGGLLNERKNWNESLIVLNYSKLAQVTKGAWDSRALRLLRGMVVDAMIGCLLDVFQSSSTGKNP